MRKLNLKPLRKPKKNSISTTVFHYSHKLKRQVWGESNLEWEVIILLDHDPSVMEYCEQTLPEIIRNKIKWTPDFVVLFKSGKLVIIECKYLVDLVDTDKKFEYLKKYKIMEQECIKHNIDFIVVTDQIVNKSSRVNNCRKYMEVMKTQNFDIYSKIGLHLVSAIGANLGITIKKLLTHFVDWYDKLKLSPDDFLVAIYVMIYSNEFSFDFSNLIDTSSQLFLRTRNDNPMESLETWLQLPDWKQESPVEIESMSIVDLHSYPKKLLDIASRRLGIIAPLLKIASNEKIVQICNETGVSRSTIRRWINRYKEGNDIRSLIPENSKKGRPKIKFDEKLMNYGIQEYLKLERPSFISAYKRMRAKAMGSYIEVPSYDTFRRRIKNLKQEEVIKRRFGHKKRDQHYTQSIKKFPHQQWALQTVQIDHTPIDVVVVDDEKRLSLERPYITVALDIHSRCVLGFALTFDKPSRLSITMALLNCVQNKESTLSKVRLTYPQLGEKLKIIESSEWKDIYGIPSTLHMEMMI